MRADKFKKLLGCPKCDGELALMPWSYILQPGRLENGVPVPSNDEPAWLPRVYICGTCGYVEFYVPSLHGGPVIEAPPGMSES